MRSSTRKADRVRVSVVALGLTLAACTSATGAVADVGDHSTDAAERTKAKALVVHDRSYDRVESLKGAATFQ